MDKKSNMSKFQGEIRCGKVMTGQPDIPVKKVVNRSFNSGKKAMVKSRKKGY